MKCITRYPAVCHVVTGKKVSLGGTNSKWGGRESIPIRSAMIATDYLLGHPLPRMVPSDSVRVFGTFGRLYHISDRPAGSYGLL
jgi:hypothetical protein